MSSREAASKNVYALKAKRTVTNICPSPQDSQIIPLLLYTPTWIKQSSVTIFYSWWGNWGPDMWNDHLYQVCESSDLISCPPGSVFLAVEDKERTQFMLRIRESITVTMADHWEWSVWIVKLSPQWCIANSFPGELTSAWPQYCMQINKQMLKQNKKQNPQTKIPPSLAALKGCQDLLVKKDIWIRTRKNKMYSLGAKNHCCISLGGSASRGWPPEAVQLGERGLLAN